MSVTFKPAVREAVGLWINIIGASGSGKTFSALRLASGISGDKPFVVIDTESRRALHYADQFNFHHADLSAPFRPSAYAEAVKAADKAGYPVIVIDSGSHCWAGDGGVLDWHEEILEKWAGDDWKKREALKMAAWIEPKMDHKRMVSAFLQVRAHIILCLRAEEKIEMVKKDGKMVIQPKQSLSGKGGFIPICDKSLPFEATVSMLLHGENPGVPDFIKLQQQHKDLFPLDKPITEESGKLLAQWASGGDAKKPDDLETKRTNVVKHFGDMGVSVERICAAVGVASVDLITEGDIVKLKAAATDIKSGSKSIIEVFPEIVTDRPEIPIEPADLDIADDETEAAVHEAENNDISPLEKLRGNVIAQLEEFPLNRRKDLIAGKTAVSKMDETELTEFATFLSGQEK